MILIIHILIALTSIAYSSYLYFDPQPSKFKPAYWLLGGTVSSGSILVITTGTNILKTCLTGLAYIGFVLTVIILAKKKLAKETARN